MEIGITQKDLAGIQRIIPIFQEVLSFWGQNALELIFGKTQENGEKKIKSALIFRLSCEHYELSVDQVINKQVPPGKTGDMTKSLSAICYFHQKYLKYTQTKIGKIIGRDKAYANKRIKYVTNLNSKIPDDRAVLEDLSQIENKIKQGLEKLQA